MGSYCSENGVRSWLMSELKALCGRTATEEGDGVPQQVLSSKPLQ